MFRFDSLEILGVRAAVLTDASDGDCRLHGADPAGAAETRARVCCALGVAALDLVCAKQVHGTMVQCAEERDRGRGVREGIDAFDATDAMATGTPDTPLAIFVADCVPVYLFDPVRRAIALVHAGREGASKRIAARTVDTLVQMYGTSPKDLHAVIGPSAGPCCYEVSEPMAEAWRASGLPASGRYLDLWAANATQLAACGVPKPHIQVSGICTICDTRFHSHRRNADGRRNMALLML